MKVIEKEGFAGGKRFDIYPFVSEQVADDNQRELSGRGYIMVTPPDEHFDGVICNINLSAMSRKSWTMFQAAMDRAFELSDQLRDAPTPAPALASECVCPAAQKGNADRWHCRDDDAAIICRCACHPKPKVAEEAAGDGGK